MATRIFRGDAPKVAQVECGIPVYIQSGSILRVYFEDAPAHGVSYTCDSSSTEDCVTGLIAAWNDSTDPLVAEATASSTDGGLTLVLTADEAGRPFGPLGCESSGTVYTSSARSEIQEIALGTLPTTGTYTLSFRGSTTAVLSAGYNAAQIQAALESLNTVGSGGVTVTTTATSGTFRITFAGSLAEKNLPAITATSHLYGPGSVTQTDVAVGVAPTNLHQYLVLPTTAVGGTFTLSWNGTTTAGIAFDSDAATITTALETAFGLAMQPSATASGGGFVLTFDASPGSYLSPAFTAVSHLTEYADVDVEVVQQGIGGENEIKAWTVYTSTTSGSYTMTFGGETSAAIQYDDNSATIQAVLEAVSTIGTGNVTVAIDSPTVSATFVNTLGEQHLGDLTADGTLTADVVLTPDQKTSGAEGTNEEQRILKTTSMISTPTAGTWTITASYDGSTETTAGLAWNANEADIQSALEALSTIGTGNVVVSSGPTQWRVTFVNGRRSRPIDQLVTRTYWQGFTAGTLVHITTQGVNNDREVQKIAFETTPLGGTWTLSYNEEAAVVLNYNAATSDVKTALEGVAGIAEVAVTGTAGLEYYITFTDTDINGNQPTLDAVQYFEPAGGGDIGIATTQEASWADWTQEWAFTGSAGAGYIDWGSGWTSGEITYAESGADVIAGMNANTSLPNYGWYGGIGGDPGGPVATANIKLATDYSHGMTESGFPAGASFVNTSGDLDASIVSTGGGTATNEVQTILFTDVCTGTYQLLYGGFPGTALDWDANAATVEAALDSIPDLDGKTAVGGSQAGGFTVEFTGFPGTNVSLLTSSTHFAAPTVSVTTPVQGIASVNEAQELWFPTATYGQVTGGTFTLTFSGYTTASITWNANGAGLAAVVDTELEALASIGTGNIQVTGTGNGPGSEVLYMTFVGDLKWDNQPPLTIDRSGLLASTPAATVTTFSQGQYGTDEAHTVTADLLPSAGTWTLAFSYDGSTATTTGLAWNTNAATVESELEAIATVGTGNVQVSGTFSSGFTVSYRNELGSLDVDMIDATSYLTHDYTPTVYLAQVGGGTGGRSEVVEITFPATVSEGSWAPVIAGESGTVIAWNANAATVEASFEAISSIGSGNVSALEISNGWRVSFVGDAAGLDIPDITIDNYLGGANLCNVVSTNGTNYTAELQALTIDYANYGYWDLGTDSQSGGAWYGLPLNANASAAEVKVALCALTGISESDVAVVKWGDITESQQVFAFTYGTVARQPLVRGRPTSDPALASIANRVVGKTRRLQAGHPTQSETQKVVVSAGGGTWALVYDGATSTFVAFNVASADLETALGPAVGAGNATVTDATTGGYLVTFAGALADTAVNNFSYVSNLTRPYIAVTTGVDTDSQIGQNAIHYLEYPSGTFWYTDLEFQWEGVGHPHPNGSAGAGLYTDYLVIFDQTTPEGMQAALNYDPFTAGNVTVTTGGTHAYIFTFSNELGNMDIPLSCWIDHGYYSGVRTATRQIQEGREQYNQKQYVSFATTPTTGTYTITFNGATTTGITYSSNATAVQAALEAVATIGHGNVTVTGGAATSDHKVWIEFIGDFAVQDQAAISATSYCTGPSDATITVTKDTVGGSAQNDIQEFDITGWPYAGTFSLVMDSEATTSISALPNAQVIQDALEALTTVGTGCVTVTAPDPSYPQYGPWTIEFNNTKAGTAMPAIFYQGAAMVPAPIHFTSRRTKEPISGVNETQHVYFLTEPTSGTFTLSFNGSTSGGIPYDASAETVQAYLNGLSTVGIFGGVTVTKNTGTGTAGGWVIAFTGSGLRWRNQPAISADGKWLTNADYEPTVTEVIKGVPAQDEIHEFTTDSDATGGTWNLTFDGITATGLAHNITASQLQTAIDGNWGAGNGTASLGPFPASPLRIEWAGNYAQTNVATATTLSAIQTMIPASISMGSIYGHGAGTDAIISFASPSYPSAGTWNITYGVQTSDDLDWNASLSDVTTALETLLGEDNVEVTGGPMPRSAFSVTFTEALGKQPISVTVNSSITRLYPTISVTTVQEGDPGTSMWFYTVTENSGPNDWSCTANWTDRTVPVAGDDVILANFNQNITWNLPDDWPHFASFTQYSSFTGEFGLRDTDQTYGDTPYTQYRQRAACFTADTIKLGVGAGLGAKYMRLDFGTTAEIQDVVIEKSQWPTYDTEHTINIAGGTASTSIYIHGGSVALASQPDETATAGTFHVAGNGTSGEAQVLLASGATVSTVVVTGGTSWFYAGCTSFTQYSGMTNIIDGTFTAITLTDRALCYYQSGENISGAVTLTGNSKMDWSRDTRSITVGSISVASTAESYDPTSRVSEA